MTAPLRIQQPSHRPWYCWLWPRRLDERCGLASWIFEGRFLCDAHAAPHFDSSGQQP